MGTLSHPFWLVPLLHILDLDAAKPRRPSQFTKISVATPTQVCMCVLGHSGLPSVHIRGLWATPSTTGLTAAGGERRKVLLVGAGMGQRLSLCISKDGGRGETWAVVLLWKDLQLQPKVLAFISEAEQSQPGAQNTV